MNFKGTDGPWFWENGVLCNKDFIIGGGGHAFHNQANANLIAAAPELLEALSALVKALNYGTSLELTNAEDLASLAIKKALGQ